MLTKHDVEEFNNSLGGSALWAISLLSGKEDWTLDGNDAIARYVKIGAALSEEDAKARLDKAETAQVSGFLALTQIERFLIALRHISEISPDTLSGITQIKPGHSKEQITWQKTNTNRLVMLARCRLIPELFGEKRMQSVLSAVYNSSNPKGEQQ